MADVSPPAARRALVPGFKDFLARWVALNWLDCICMAVLGGLTFGVFLSKSCSCSTSNLLARFTNRPCP